MTGFRGVFDVLTQRTYGTFIAGNALSLIGTWMQRIGVGWLTWELTGSGAWLGLMAFADLFPSVILGPIGGAVADRVSRLRIIKLAQSLAMLQAAALFVLVATGWITVWSLLALVLLGGAAVGFSQPARLALVPSLVARDDMSTAIAINAIVFNLARFIGPALAGLLIVGVDIAAVFAANAVSYLAFLLALSRIRLAPAADRSGAGRRSLFGDVAEGVAYVIGHPGIGPLLLLLTVLSIGVRPFVELLPGFAAAVFGRGADGLAILSATVGVGAVVSGLWLAQQRHLRGLVPLVLVAVLVVALAILGFVATDRFWLGVAAVAVAGLAMVVSGVGTQTLLQLAVEGTMRGRVMSLYGIIFRAGPALGALIMGLASEGIGLRWPLAGGALLAIMAWIWTWRRRKAIAAALAPGG